MKHMQKPKLYNMFSRPFHNILCSLTKISKTGVQPLHFHKEQKFAFKCA